MVDIIVEVCEVALIGGLAVMLRKAKKEIEALRKMAVFDRSIVKQLYEKNASRWAEHVKSRMH